MRHSSCLKVKTFGAKIEYKSVSVILNIDCSLRRDLVTSLKILQDR